jgi:regulator of replication initiation timing
MLLIDKLRAQIERAISRFQAENPDMDQERVVNINRIRTILKGNNPINVKVELSDYLESLSSGFFSLLPFFEINRFKNQIQEVLGRPHFEETPMLRTLVMELTKITQTSRNSASSDSVILSRLDNLEGNFRVQSASFEELKAEVNRLRVENQFLTKTVSLLSDTNKELASKNRTLEEDKTKLVQDQKNLKLKYEALIAENIQLKAKLQALEDKREFPFTPETSTKNSSLTRSSICRYSSTPQSSLKNPNNAPHLQPTIKCG